MVIIIVSLNTAIYTLNTRSPLCVVGPMEAERFWEQISEPCAIVYLRLA